MLRRQEADGPGQELYRGWFIHSHHRVLSLWCLPLLAALIVGLGTSWLLRERSTHLLYRLPGTEPTLMTTLGTGILFLSSLLHHTQTRVTFSGQ